MNFLRKLAIFIWRIARYPLLGIFIAGCLICIPIPWANYPDLPIWAHILGYIGTFVMAPIFVILLGNSLLIIGAFIWEDFKNLWKDIK